MAIMRLHHANISIPPDSEAEARAFYCGLLGLPEIEKPDALKPNGGFWLRSTSACVPMCTSQLPNRNQKPPLGLS
ncbi:MAG: glyoxalase, partial [Chloroflexota bacterium]